MKKNDKLKDFLSNFKVAKIKTDPESAKRLEELNLGKIIKEDDKTFVYIDNRKDITVLAPDDEAFKNLLDLFFNKKIPWVKENIAGENSLVLEDIRRPKEIIKKLAPYIFGEDYGALSYSYGIIKQEDKKMDTLEMDKRLIDAYGPRGKRIYSLLRSGMLENEFWPLIKDMDGDKIRKKFNEIINSPPGIFVGKWMKKKDVIDKINKKLSENYSDFPIFARSGKVEIAIEAIEEMMKGDPYIVYYPEKNVIGKDDAVTIHFFKLYKQPN